MKPTEWTKDQLEFLIKNYLDLTLVELETCLGISQSVVFRKIKSLDLPSKNIKNRIEKKHGKGVCDLLTQLHWDENLSVNQISEKLQVSRIWIYQQMNLCKIDWRDQSTAQKVVWDNRSDEEKKLQCDAAHSRTRELTAKNESALIKWRNLHPELAREINRKNAKSMSITRERNNNNWMKGRSGVLCPSWKGGKNEYHRLRGIANGSWTANRKNALRRDNYTCQECQRKLGDVILDVHHIVPVRNGGDNTLSNLICLCKSCHSKKHLNLNSRVVA